MNLAQLNPAIDKEEIKNLQTHQVAIEEALAAIAKNGGKIKNANQPAEPLARRPKRAMQKKIMMLLCARSAAKALLKMAAVPPLPEKQLSASAMRQNLYLRRRNITGSCM